MPLTSFLVITFILFVANSALSLKIHLRIEDNIDDDKEVENEESILDKIERELNDDVNLTDGFYSSDDDGDAFDAERLKKNDQIKEADEDSHRSNLPNDGQIDFQDSDQEEVKNFFP